MSAAAPTATPAEPQVVFFKESPRKVEAAIRKGKLDFADGSRWSAIDRFFAFLQAKDFFGRCASAFPDPRKKVEVPLVILLASTFVLRLHDQSAFAKLPFVLAAAANLFRVRFNLAIFTGQDSPLAENGGFNRRNKKARRSIFDQDTARKFYGRVDPDHLHAWHNESLSDFLSAELGGDARLLILDSSLLPLPDNDHYERAHRMPLDDKLHLAKRDEEAALFRPCYKLTSLLRTGEDGGPFACVGASLDSGNTSELTVGCPLLLRYLERHPGEIDFVVVDRGFLDGEWIGEVKQVHRVDVIVPLKSDMNAVEDVRGLMKIAPPKWLEVRRTTHRKRVRGEKARARDAKGKKRKTGPLVTVVHEVAIYRDVRSYERCPVPLSVVAVRETKTTERRGAAPEVEVSEWFLATTKADADAEETYHLYERRTQIEERYRQLKEVRWWAMGAFTSTSFPLVATQVLLTLAVYSLHQLYLVHRHNRELTRQTIERLRWEDRFAGRDIIVYAGGTFAIMETLDLLALVMSLEGEPRTRLKKKIARLQNRILNRHGGAAP